jgi:hypothetical protein
MKMKSPRQYGTHDEGDNVKHSSSKGMLYKNECDMPHLPAQGRPEHGHGAEDFKGMAMDIAYGQAGKAGMTADDKRLRAQHKNYHWADSPAEEMPGSY